MRSSTFAQLQENSDSERDRLRDASHASEHGGTAVIDEIHGRGGRRDRDSGELPVAPADREQRDRTEIARETLDSIVDVG